jgi:hypothetical protein
MATIATRLTNTGNLLVNGTIDEVTYNGNTSFASSTVTDTVYATGEFDEISITGGSVARRIAANGAVQISGIFDELTGAPVVNNNLRLWVDAAQPTSYPGLGSTWTDLSSNGNNFTLVNSPTFNSLDFGGSIRFTNTFSQYGTGTGTPVNSTAYTKSVWFKLSGLADNNLLSSAAGGHFMFFAGTNTLYSGHSDWPVYTAYGSTTVFSTNIWYNVCLTFDTTNGMTLYVNGVLDSTYTARKTAVSGTGQTNLGSFAPGGNLLNGFISQAMIYNRILTADEVGQNFNALRRRYNI